MRGIILAEGTGSRLWPATLAVPKQLVPVYDKPMIYYPLSTLLLSGIKDILIVSTPQDTPGYQRLLSDGGKWGISLSYAVLAKSRSLVEAFTVGSEFIGNNLCASVLGNNIFYGPGLSESLHKVATLKRGARIIACQVDAPGPYGVVTIDKNGKACDLEENPVQPESGYAVTGLGFYDDTVAERVRSLTTSGCNQPGITDLNRTYLDDGALSVEVFNQDMTWLDMDTHESLLDAARVVEAIEKRQGIKICCPEEACWRMGYIDDGQLEKLADEFRNDEYGYYLAGLPDSRAAASAL